MSNDAKQVGNSKTRLRRKDMWMESRVGLNPTPKTDEHGDDGDGYNDKDEMNRHMKMQVKMDLRPNPNEVESKKSNLFRKSQRS